MTHTCRTGRHTWFDESDALRCCDPRYLRRLVVAEDGCDLPAGVNRIDGLPVAAGYCWMRVDDGERVAEVTP